MYFDQSTPLLKLRTHAQTRIHTFSAGDAFAESSENGKGGNERRRSLCDGGGAAVFWRNSEKNAARSQKCLKYRCHESAHPANASQTVCLGGGGDEPMRGAKARTHNRSLCRRQQSDNG
jgi:hypothetical protein